MAHFKDLEKCDYFGGQLKDVLLAVGWLDKDHEFSQGKVSEVNMDLLKMYCEKPLWVHVFRGFHDCNLCETQGSRNDNKGVFSNAGLFGVQKASGQLESGIGKRKSALNVFPGMPHSLVNKRPFIKSAVIFSERKRLDTEAKEIIGGMLD